MGAQVLVFVRLRITRLLDNSKQCVSETGCSLKCVNHPVTNIHLECAFWPATEPQSAPPTETSDGRYFKKSVEGLPKKPAFFGASGKQDTFLFGRLGLCVCVHVSGTSYFAALKIKVPLDFMSLCMLHLN